MKREHPERSMVVPSVGSPAAEPVPCTHLGSPVPPPDANPTGKAWFRCDNPTQPLGSPVCSCRGCGAGCRGFAAAAPDRVTRIDSDRLADTMDGRRFNCSVLDYRGRRLLAYRVGWSLPDIWVAELDADDKPSGNTKLNLPHPKCFAGREDPRLLVLRDRLHLSFAGLSYEPGKPLAVKVMLARLSDSLAAERVWEPVHPRARHVEKNWQFFGADGKEWCVYGVHPHRVLRVDYDAGTAADGFETPWRNPWASSWELRGGAPPVRVGGEFFHWFHGWRREPGREQYTYAAGVYAFAAEPPFRVTRIVPGAVWQPDAAKRHLNVTKDKDVIYPCGAAFDGRRWVVSAGHQDAECLLGEFDHTTLESLMEPA